MARGTQFLDIFPECRAVGLSGGRIGASHNGGGQIFSNKHVHKDLWLWQAERNCGYSDPLNGSGREITENGWTARAPPACLSS
jgi:hypothetical protein